MKREQFIKNKYKILSCVFLVAFFLTVFFYFNLHQYFRLSLLQTYQEQLKDFYIQSPIATLLVYFFLYILVTGLSIPGATVLTLAGGFLFGLLKGVVMVSVASCTGALVAFLLSRFFIRDFLLGMILEEEAALKKGRQSIFSYVADIVKIRLRKPIETISEKIKTEGAYFLFMLRLVPLFPFFVVNLVMGLTPIKVRTFFWVSQLGMLPATVLYVNAGTQLSQLETLKDIVSFPFLVSFALLGFFPLFIKHFFSKWIYIIR